MSSDKKMCWIGRAAQKLCCTPNKSDMITTVHYQTAAHPVDSNSVYNNSIKYKSSPRLPPPQPEEPRQQMTPSMGGYQYQSPHVPKSSKKTSVTRMDPPSTPPLSVRTSPTRTPTATCISLNADLPSVLHPAYRTVQTVHTPRSAPPSVVPRTPRQNAGADSILPDLRNIPPTRYVWEIPQGTLTLTPNSILHFPPRNSVPNLRRYSSRIVDLGDGDDEPMGLGLIPIPSNSSDSSSNCSDLDRRLGIQLHPLLASNRRPEGTHIKWNVSEPVDMARHTLNDTTFLASAPATEPPANELRVHFYFFNEPMVRRNWDPITMRKRHPIRIADVLHAIHDYFQMQLTRSEYDIIKSHGERNTRIAANSRRGRVISEFEGDMRSTISCDGFRRVDCLGSSKIFAGLWVEGSQLKLGLRA